MMAGLWLPPTSNAELLAYRQFAEKVRAFVIERRKARSTDKFDNDVTYALGFLDGELDRAGVGKGHMKDALA